MKTKYSHPALGEITVNRSVRARRISLAVRPSGVTLTLPLRFPLQEGVAFAESKQAWIEKAKRRMAERTKPPRVIRPAFRTRMHELKVEEGGRPGIVIRNGIVNVILPPGSQIESPDSQAILKKALTEALRVEAKAWLPARVAGLAARWGFTYASLAFRNTVSRWGSCSAQNAISLSINLMILPDHLIDYVILHELCHTVHKNHGPRFHALLDRVTGGDHRDLNRQLKGHTPRW